MSLLHPGCHENEHGLICADVQRWNGESWTDWAFERLMVGDIFRQSQDGAWDNPYRVTAPPKPTGEVDEVTGNFGLEAVRMDAEQIQAAGVTP